MKVYNAKILELDKRDLLKKWDTIGLDNLEINSFKFSLRNIARKSDLVIFREGKFCKILKNRFE